MRFERLRDEVVMAERRVETRMLRAQTNWRVLKTVWRESWTPARILAIGLAGGFLFGRSKPLRKMRAVSPTRWIQLATSISGLMATFRAKQAAESAEVAAADAGQAAAEAEETVEAVAEGTPGVELTPDTPVRSVSDARRRPEAPWTGEPRPAEAATEVSER